MVYIKNDSRHAGDDANYKDTREIAFLWLFCTHTYAVIVVGKDETVIAAAVEGTNRVAASAIPTGISFTLIYV